MRTPRDIARALGWPEARRKDERITVFCNAPDCGWKTPVGSYDDVGPVSEAHRATHPPKLTVRRDAPGSWTWEIVQGGGSSMGWAPSQPAALALGLAALDTTRSHR